MIGTVKKRLSLDPAHKRRIGSWIDNRTVPIIISWLLSPLLCGLLFLSLNGPHNIDGDKTPSGGQEMHQPLTEILHSPSFFFYQIKKNKDGEWISVINGWCEHNFPCLFLDRSIVSVCPLQELFLSFRRTNFKLTMSRTVIKEKGKLCDHFLTRFNLVFSIICTVAGSIFSSFSVASIRSFPCEPH